jgi:hypothetical protein
LFSSPKQLLIAFGQQCEGWYVFWLPAYRVLGMQAAARLVSTVIFILVSHHDRAEQATLGNDAVRRRRPEGR